MDEARWIATNWKRLETLHGLLNDDSYEDTKVREVLYRNSKLFHTISGCVQYEQ
jgi:hypothetical protein